MQLCSFCGYFSLQTGVVTIGILHLISAVSLLVISDIPTFERHIWDSFYWMLIPFSIALLVGVAKKNMDRVFPFLGLQYVITVFLGIRIGEQLRQEIEASQEYKPGAIILSCEIARFLVMLYFFMVLYSYYKNLMCEQVRHSLSIGVNNNAALNCEKIPNNVQPQQTINNNTEEQAINMRCDDIKK